MDSEAVIARFARKLLCCAVAAVLCPNLADAQHTYRNLTGVVTDRQHEPLNGAVVEVHDDNTKSVISYITSRSGKYSFMRLDGNSDYHVWASYRGHRSPEKTISTFDSRGNKVVNLRILLP